jgi:branched-chain amino acid transport system permease protein
MLWAAAFAAAALLPLFGGDYLLQIGGFVAIQSIAVIGLGLLTGFAGRISLAQGALYGIGAYNTAILVTQHAVPPLAALPAAIAMAVAVGTMLGSPAIRLSGLYFVMSTIGLQQIVWIVLIHWSSLTGRPQGIRGIPPLSVPGFAFDTPGRFYLAAWPGPPCPSSWRGGSSPAASACSCAPSAMMSCPRPPPVSTSSAPRSWPWP